MESQYRYPGTRPFLEEDSHLFFGRDSDREKLTELIVLEELVVLFGKSGYGKSSLLNAAVIPGLRRHEKHEVFTVRLIEPARRNEPKRSPLELLTEVLKMEVNDTAFLTEKLDIPVELPEDITARIWYYAKILQLTRPESNAITLVFDQFEELRHFSGPEVEAFGSSLSALLHLEAPKSVRNLISQKYEANAAYFTREERHDLLKSLNLKVVFSLHHDRLNLLDQLKQSLPSVFKYTYELKPLNDLQAREALHRPAALEEAFASPPFIFSEAATTFIFNSLKDSKNHLIEPFELQLIGQHSEEKIIARQKKAEQKARGNKPNKKRDATRLELGIKDLDKPETIFKKHYDKVIAGLPFSNRGRVRKLIQTVLIVEGNRVPMPEFVITSQHRVSKDVLEHLLDKRLLRSELNTVQDTSYELSHDTLVKPIREAARRRKQRRLWIIVISVFLFIIAGLLGNLYQLKYVTESNGIIINPIATATVLPTEGPSPLDVTFVFTEKKPVGKITVVSHHWDFGERGDPSTSDTILHHLYANPGKYKVVLTVMGSDGKLRTEDVRITVTEPETPPQEEDSVATDGTVSDEEGLVVISANPGTGTAPLEVTFSSSVSPGIAVKRYLWEFSDPYPSKEPGPSHIFRGNRDYDVRLTVWDTLGNTFTRGTKIKVGPLASVKTGFPVAKATASPPGGQVPLTVTFSGKESIDDVAITGYLWEFQDGSISKARDTLYTFDSVGRYDVRLTVWDHEGQHDSQNLDIEVHANGVHPPRAVAAASTLSGKVPLEVRFSGRNANDNGSEATYRWDFRDGPVSSEQNPVHRFNRPGIYEVQLKLIDNHSRADSMSLRITALALDTIPPVAIASATINNENTPSEYRFTGSNSTDNISVKRYLWRFEHGATSSEPDPIYAFRDPGEYDVQLTVWDAEENNDSTVVGITIPAPPDPLIPPRAVIDADKTSGRQPLKVSFSGRKSTDDGSIVSYHWDFKDGYTSDDTVASHTFTDAGIYNVSLRVEDDKGLPGEAAVTIMVDPYSGKDAEIEYKTWIERFISVQEQHLPSEFDNPNGWKNWRIIPDSLNLMGIVLSDPSGPRDAPVTGQPALLFFFTTRGVNKGDGKVYKFRNELHPGRSNALMRSQRFNLKGLIRQARNAKNKDSTGIQKLIGPDGTTVNLEQSEIKDLAGLLEQNKINDKTLNMYYTSFPYSYFDEATRKEIDTIYQLLRPSRIGVEE